MFRDGKAVRVTDKLDISDAEETQLFLRYLDYEYDARKLGLEPMSYLEWKFEENSDV